jgi:flagellar hook-length control protein FliK
MNTTEQPAKGNAKTLDIMNLLRAAENKAGRKANPAGHKSFDALLNEKSLAIEGKAGQAKALPSGRGRIAASKQALLKAVQDGAAATREDKLSSAGKDQPSDPNLPAISTDQEKIPSALAALDTQEGEENTLQEQLAIATLTAAARQDGDAQATAPATLEIDKKPSAKQIEANLPERAPDPSRGSAPAERQEPKVDATAIRQDIPADHREAGAGHPFEGIAAKTAVTPLPAALQQTGSQSREVMGSQDRPAASPDDRQRNSFPVDQEAGSTHRPEMTLANRTELPLQGSMAAPAMDAISGKLPDAAPLSAGDRRLESVAGANEAQQNHSSKEALPEGSRNLSSRREHGKTPAADPNVPQARESRIPAAGTAGKGAALAETSREEQGRRMAGADNPLLKDGQRPLAEKAAPGERPNLRQEATPERLPGEIGASGPEPNDVEGMTIENINRAALRRDETTPASTPKEALYLAADAAKKAADTLKNEKETARSRALDSEIASARTATTSRVLPVKETLTVYAAAAEMEKDRLRTGTAKTAAEDKMATLAAGMKPFGEHAPVSGKKGPEADGISGVKAQALIDQLVEARQQMSSDSGRIKITLTPPNLGTVDLDVIVRQNRVEVIMTTDHSDVQQLLQARGEDIKSALQRQDMKIDSYQVFLQSSPDGSQQQTGSWTAMQDHSRKGYASPGERTDERDDPAVLEDLSIHPNSGIVSIFA